MLEGMKRVVSVLVAVGRSVRTGVCETVVDGITKTGVDDAITDEVVAGGDTLADAGADADSEGERVAEGATDEDSMPVETDPEAEGATETDPVAEALTVALLESDTEIEAVSEAGIDDGMLRDSLGVTVALDETPVPDAVPDGRIPEETSEPDRVKVGRRPEEADTEALAEGVTLPVPVGRGDDRLIEPDIVAEGRIPDDWRPDENSEAMLDAMLLSSEVGMGRGIDAVGKIDAVESADSALDTRLDNTPEAVGRSETADDKRLESSEITDGTTDGRIPEADGDGVMEADAGAVGLMAPELGVTPVGRTSETTDDRNEGRFSPEPELVETPSEVGIAPDSEASLVGVAGVADADEDADSVLSAVVMPIMIPLPLEERAPVGTTPLLGRIPDSRDEVGVGSGLPRREDKSEPTRPPVLVGWTISEAGGRSPVDAASVG
jgi:hypothetical protein